MTGQMLSFPGVRALRCQAAQDKKEAPFGLEQCAGRLVEISQAAHGAALTVAVQLVWQAQRDGEPTAWVTRDTSTFYPPDVAQSGVDVSALAVVRVRDEKKAARAADHLVRSGAFGLVILDLGKDAELSLPMQGRLLGLSQKHGAALVCLTDKKEDMPSLGSMVSLRAAAWREPLQEGRFRCKIKVLKDKRRGPHWSDEMVAHGPAGLR